MTSAETDYRVGAAIGEHVDAVMDTVNQQRKN